MTFLFEAIALHGTDHVLYRVYQTDDHTYFAEFTGTNGSGWHFRRVQDDWIAEDPDLQYQAEQLGEEVDRKKLQ